MSFDERSTLLLGKENIEKLKRATVFVAGVGGVGSHCIEALARMGIGKLILVDHDMVSESNINRQSIAYYSTIGRHKTELMRDRIRDISPDTKVITHEVFMMPDNIPSFFSEPIDYVVDAIDNVTAKIAIVCMAKEKDIPVISCMGTGNKLHAEFFRIEDLHRTKVCPLCKVMRRELKKRGIERLKVLYSEEEPMKTQETCKEGVRPVPGSVSFVPPVAGLLIAGEVIRDLTGLG